jgi:hypothetical protein
MEAIVIQVMDYYAQPIMEIIAILQMEIIVLPMIKLIWLILLSATQKTKFLAIKIMEHSVTLQGLKLIVCLTTRAHNYVTLKMEFLASIIIQAGI